MVWPPSKDANIQESEGAEERSDAVELLLRRRLVGGEGLSSRSKKSLSISWHTRYSQSAIISPLGSYKNARRNACKILSFSLFSYSFWYREHAHARLGRCTMLPFAQIIRYARTQSPTHSTFTSSSTTAGQSFGSNTLVARTCSPDSAAKQEKCRVSGVATH